MRKGACKSMNTRHAKQSQRFRLIPEEQQKLMALAEGRGRPVQVDTCAGEGRGMAIAETAWTEATDHPWDGLCVWYCPMQKGDYETIGEDLSHLRRCRLRDPQTCGFLVLPLGYKQIWKKVLKEIPETEQVEHFKKWAPVVVGPDGEVGSSPQALTVLWVPPHDVCQAPARTAPGETTPSQGMDPESSPLSMKDFMERVKIGGKTLSLIHI